MVLDPQLRHVAANSTYLKETGSRLEDLLGRYVFERFPNDPDDPNNAPTRMLQRSLERVLATPARDHLALIPYRVPREVDGHLVSEGRFWSATHTPLLGADGQVTLGALRSPFAPPYVGFTARAVIWFIVRPVRPRAWGPSGRLTPPASSMRSSCAP